MRFVHSLNIPIGACVIAVVLMAAPGFVRGSLATFDSLEEGFYSGPLVDGGITFFDADSRFGPKPSGILAIDDVSEAFPLFPDYTPFFSGPNVLSMVGIGSGPGFRWSWSVW